MGTSRSRSSWRNPLLAAAAALALVGAVMVAVWQLRDDESGPALPSGPTVRVPSVFGYDGPDAVRMLEDRGFSVETTGQDSCEPVGRALRTEPAAGDRARKGQTVTVLLAASSDRFACILDPGRKDAWAFLDFANHRGPAPDFAKQVTVVVQNSPPITISGSEAARGEHWGKPSVLALLRKASRADGMTEGFSKAVLQSALGTPPTHLCAGPRPQLVGDREALTLTLASPGQGAARCSTVVHLYRTKGRIDTVVAWPPTSLTASNPEHGFEPPPKVKGLPPSRARSLLNDAGYTVRVEHQETCHPRGGVVDRSWTRIPGTDERRHVTLFAEKLSVTKDCPALKQAAADLATFANGGPPPAFADRVQLLLGHRLMVTLDAAEAADRQSWEICPDSGVAGCPRSALAAIADAEATATHEGWYPVLRQCDPIDLGAVPLSLTDEHEIVMQPAPVPDRCRDAWILALWIDGQGRIAAVNLVPTEEPG